MDKLDENTKLIAYVPVETAQINKLQRVLTESGYDIELVTTEEFFKQVKFKQMSPRA